MLWIGMLFFSFLNNSRILTLYSKPLSLDIASRVWDVFFMDGESFIFRTALGLLRYLRAKLEDNTFEGCLYTLTHLDEIEEEKLFENIEKVNLSPDQFEKLLTQARTKTPAVS